jgi:ABC-type polysaccharide/polyol phosphate transport system ATPase subunit
MNDIVIKAKNLTKRYKTYTKDIDQLIELIPGVSEKHKKITIIDNISFEIKKGEIVGIVGANGAGKSTLLKIITGVSSYEGELEVKGRIASLLELGTGFDPELTGIENIYFQGYLMGYTREEIGEKIADIIDFADIGDYINEPVKKYSSGMFARLAFSTAINVEPEILIVDEVLSVGDVKFQMKCLKRIEELGHAGTTILFVSHNENQISRYCDRAIWINEKRIFRDGLPSDVIPYYRDFMIFGEIGSETIKQENDSKIEIKSDSKDLIGSQEIKVKSIEVSPLINGILDVNEPSISIKLIIENSDSKIKDIFVSTLLTNDNNFPIAHTGVSCKDTLKVNEIQELNIEFANINFKNGDYALSIDIGDITNGEFKLITKLNNIVIFKVFEKDELREGQGIFYLDSYRAQIK